MRRQTTRVATRTIAVSGEPGANEPPWEYRIVPERAGPSGATSTAGRSLSTVGVLLIPPGIKRTPTVLSDRPAVLVAPEGPARSGTILYSHGGSFAPGSPETAMVLVATLVV